MDICKGGELYDEYVNRGRFLEKETAVLMKQLLQVVHYMHECHVVHRDLKPENILLDQTNDYSMIKVIDFGTACVQKDNGYTLSDRIGTPYYMAPEIMH